MPDICRNSSRPQNHKTNYVSTGIAHPTCPDGWRRGANLSASAEEFARGVADICQLHLSGRMAHGCAYAHQRQGVRTRNSRRVSKVVTPKQFQRDRAGVRIRAVLGDHRVGAGQNQKIGWGRAIHFGFYLSPIRSYHQGRNKVKCSMLRSWRGGTLTHFISIGKL